MLQWEAQVAHIVDALSTVPGATARRVYPGEPGVQPVRIPRAHIEWTPAVISDRPEQIKDKLLQGDPPVVVGVNAAGLVINPQLLAAGQERIVADCIKRVLLGDQ
jgi:hypothetical protein